MLLLSFRCQSFFRWMSGQGHFGFLRHAMKLESERVPFQFTSRVLISSCRLGAKDCTRDVRFSVLMLWEKALVGCEAAGL